jgi:hypothetical protein
VSAWKLTVRHGPEVTHQRFDDLDAALEQAQRRIAAFKAEGPLKKVSMLRDFDPSVQVHARLEISGKGLLRPPTAGVDLRGDGSLVAFTGSLGREELTAEGDETPFDLVRRALEPAGS